MNLRVCKNVFVIFLLKKTKKIFLFVLLLAQNIVKQVVNGLVYLHNHGIIHRDIKLSNLLLTETLEVVSKIHSFVLNNLRKFF